MKLELSHPWISNYTTKQPQISMEYKKKAQKWSHIFLTVLSEYVISWARDQIQAREVTMTDP